MDTSAAPSAEIVNSISAPFALAFSPRLEIVIGPTNIALACAITGAGVAVGGMEVGVGGMEVGVDGMEVGVTVG